MERYEYRLVKAPGPACAASGVHPREDGLAEEILEIMNEAGREGWQFLRRESLAGGRPSGWLRRRAQCHDYLVFRRPLPAPKPAPGPDAAPKATNRPPRRKKMSAAELEKLRANIRKALGPEVIELHLTM
jgi:hypothetical protein